MMSLSHGVEYPLLILIAFCSPISILWNMTTASITTEKLLTRVLREVQSLRRDVSLIIPSESLDEYAHPARIIASYRRAAKKHPPRDA